MSDERNNCIILLINSPVAEYVPPELAASFGAERAARINLDLLQNAYRAAKKIKDTLLILSYDKTPRHPDLTWLDGDDPGFLNAKGRDPENRLVEAFQLAFNTGVKKALLLNHLSPAINPEWLARSFEAVNEKTIALGLNQDGSAYLLGLTAHNLKFLEGLSFMPAKAAEEISEKAKKNKFNVFSPPASFAVKDEDTMRQWLGAKEPVPSLFVKEAPPTHLSPPSAAAAPPEEKKHGRRAHKNPVTPPPLPGTEKPPI
jgi:hypothetical protein